MATKANASDRLLLRAATPRLNHYIPHRPTPRQAAFLIVPGREAFYGGAAGGGKSDALLMAALQYVDVSGYAAVLVRESYQMLTQPGGLIDRAREWLTPSDALWNAGDHQWRFPSGATLTFRHLQDAGAERNFQGAEYHFIGIDEVTDFTEDKYRFLFSRLRRQQDSQIPLRMRAASNPYGPGLEWCHRRFVIEGRYAGRVFIPARLEDNPFLDQSTYEANLKELGPLVYRQLRHGDWTVRPEGGLFRSAWFDDRFLDRRLLPERLRLCRSWDLAATDARKGGDPDFTAGVLLGRTPEGVSYVIDVVRTRSTPLLVERLVRSTAERDAKWAADNDIDRPMIVMEQEPGSAGVAVIDHYRQKVLPEFAFKGVRATGTKEMRATPVAARAEAGELVICGGRWNTDFLDELVAFPTGSHDDQVDALAGAYGHLAKKKSACLPIPVDMWRPSPWNI